MRSFECQRRADLLNNLRALIRRCRIKAVFNTSRDHGIELRVRHTLPKSTAVYFRLRDAPHSRAVGWAKVCHGPWPFLFPRVNRSPPDQNVFASPPHNRKGHTENKKDPDSGCLGIGLRQKVDRQSDWKYRQQYSRPVQDNYAAANSTSCSGA